VGDTLEIVTLGVLVGATVGVVFVGIAVGVSVASNGTI
jgi:hypothetical protein